MPVTSGWGVSGGKLFIKADGQKPPRVHACVVRRLSGDKAQTGAIQVWWPVNAAASLKMATEDRFVPRYKVNKLIWLFNRAAVRACVRGLPSASTVRLCDSPRPRLRATEVFATLPHIY